MYFGMLPKLITRMLYIKFSSTRNIVGRGFMVWYPQTNIYILKKKQTEYPDIYTRYITRVSTQYIRK